MSLMPSIGRRLWPPDSTLREAVAVEEGEGLSEARRALVGELRGLHERPRLKRETTQSTAPLPGGATGSAALALQTVSGRTWSRERRPVASIAHSRILGRPAELLHICRQLQELEHLPVTQRRSGPPVAVDLPPLDGPRSRRKAVLDLLRTDLLQGDLAGDLVNRETVGVHLPADDRLAESSSTRSPPSSGLRYTGRA